MNKSVYDQLVAKTRMDIENLIQREDDQTIRQSVVVSASLLNYLPEIHWNKHEGVFKKVLLSQRLSYFDQSQKQLLNQAQLVGLTYDDLMLLKSNPGIICTFHFGSYRLINLLLTTRGIPFSLVVSRTVINMQGASISDLYNHYKSEQSESNIQIIDAEAPASALQMLRTLKSGKSLVVYIDGNTGAGDATFDSANCLEIPFLDKTIKARKGVATLSYLTKVPIIPLVSIRAAIQKNVLKFGSKIFPSFESNKDEFVQSATARLFSFVETHIRKDPGQWESWLYLHKFASYSTGISHVPTKKTGNYTGTVKFNARAFGLFRLNKKHILLKKENYISYIIDSSVYELLKESRRTAVSTEDIDFNIASELISCGALITDRPK